MPENDSRSGNIKVPFSWSNQIEKTLLKKLDRQRHLERINPDTQRKYPNECRDNPKRELKLKCHPEAEKRIKHDHVKLVQASRVPPVQRPARPNRYA